MLLNIKKYLSNRYWEKAGTRGMQIYYYRDHYADRRNIIGKIPNADYILLPDTAYYELPTLQFPELGHSYYAQNIRRNNSINHFFNYINLGDADYITTFETHLPRKRNSKFYNPANTLKALEHVAADKCKAIIAISADAAKRQIEVASKWCPPTMAQKIISKLHTLHPPQPLVGGNHALNRNCINFIFIGHEFYRKGGIEVLAAFRDLASSFSNFHLYIVSNLSINKKSNVAQASSLELAQAKATISEADYITWYPELPNEEVLGLLRQCDVGLLPTYAETYGYSVLEMQAAGVPVITTWLRALPETNSPETGWIIDLRDELRGSLPRGEALATRGKVKNSLVEIIASILADPGQILPRKKASLKRIRAEHDPEKHARRLARIYLGQV